MTKPCTTVNLIFILWLHEVIMSDKYIIHKSADASCDTESLEAVQAVLDSLIAQGTDIKMLYTRSTSFLVAISKADLNIIEANIPIGWCCTREVRYEKPRRPGISSLLTSPSGDAEPVLH